MKTTAIGIWAIFLAAMLIGCDDGSPAGSAGGAGGSAVSSSDAGAGSTGSAGAAGDAATGGGGVIKAPAPICSDWSGLPDCSARYASGNIDFTEFDSPTCTGRQCGKCIDFSNARLPVEGCVIHGAGWTVYCAAPQAGSGGELDFADCGCAKLTPGSADYVDCSSGSPPSN